MSIKKNLKNFYIFIFLIIFSNCYEIYIPRRFQSPNVVFKNWQYYARKRDYDKMLEYEYFKFENVQYTYDKLYKPKTWLNSTPEEQKDFINLYKETIKKLLAKIPDEKYEALLRLKKSYNIHITKYVIDMISETGEIYIAGDYPGEEKIRIIMINNKWYLINPFGYHSFIPTLKTLKEEKNIKK